MKLWGVFFLTIFLLLGCANTRTIESHSLLSDLQSGGYVIFFRHAATDHTQEDTDFNNLANCDAQRRLDEKGKAQAALIGEGFKSGRIPVGEVVSSHYCRCINTAKIAFGRVETSNDITSLQGISADELARRLNRIRELSNTQPAEGKNNIYVSHKILLKEALLQIIEEGDAIILKPQNGSQARVIRIVKPEDWKRLGAVPSS